MKNTYRILLIIVIISLIILSILICIRSKDFEKKEDNPPLSPVVEVETVREGVIIPSNSVAFFSKYSNARVESKDIYETIDYFAKNIVLKYINEVSKMSDTELKNYYENSNYGKDDLIEVNSFEEFDKIVNKTEVYSESSKILKIAFDPESIEVKDDCITAALEFELENHTVISFNMKIYNHATEEGKFIYFYM